MSSSKLDYATPGRDEISPADSTADGDRYLARVAAAYLLFLTIANGGFVLIASVAGHDPLTATLGGFIMVGNGIAFVAAVLQMAGSLTRHRRWRN